MQSWSEITHYAGFDWATDHYDVVIVNPSGKIVADFQIEHTAEGWQRWREQVAVLGPGVAACVETSQGVVVEQLLESGVAVYPVSTTSAKPYRQRKVPSGNKTDHADAWSLADALRVDGHGWKALAKEDPLVAELRLLCRDEVALIQERQRWLKILWKMWQTGTRYDAELHPRNQLKHGSWVLKIQHA